MEFQLRPGTEADADFIMALTETVIRTHFEETWGAWDAEFQWNEFRQSFESLDHHIIMCDGERAGYRALRRTGDVIGLSKLYLLPVYQNQGIGSSIIRDLIQESKEASQKLQLHIVPENRGAKRFYERLGFAVTGMSGKLMCMEYQPQLDRNQFSLFKPSLEFLPGYADAVRRGWDWVNRDQLEEIERDPAGFVAQLENPEGIGTIALPDGSSVPRLPCFQRWFWDGEFCGLIDFRWQHGTTDLPPTCLGHIGYGVVPWKQNRGYAKQGLKLLLPEVRALGLPYIEIAVIPDKIASQKVVTANGGQFVEKFTIPATNGGGECLRYRIML